MMGAGQIEGQALLQHIAVAGGLKEQRGHVELGGQTRSQTLLVRVWPEAVEPGMFAPLLARAAGSDVRLSWHFVPTEIRWDAPQRWKLRRLEAVVAEQESKPGGLVDPDVARALESLQRLREATAFGGGAVFDVWCAITVSDQDEERLADSVRQIERVLDGLGMAAARLPYDQLPGFLFGMPLWPRDGAFTRRWPGRLADDASAAALLPVVDGGFGDGAGVYVGHRAADGSATYIDPSQGELNKNFIVLGASGQGKSTFIKALIMSLLLEDYRVFVFDVDGEYRALCDAAGGLWVDQTLSSGRYLDPLEVPEPIGDPEADAARLDECAGTLHRAVSLLAGGVSPAEANAADRALIALWEAAGIDRDDPATWDRPSGGIHGWYDQLAKLAVENEAARSLQDRIWRFFEGTGQGMFREADRGQYDADLVVFHVAQHVNQEGDQLAGAVKMALAQGWVWRELRRERVRAKRWSAVVFDEGQRLLQDQASSGFLLNVATTIRKFNGLVVLATNVPAALWATDGGRGVWENSTFKVMFWMEDGPMAEVERNAELSPALMDTLRSLHGTRRFVMRYGERGWDVLGLELPEEEVAMYRTRGVASYDVTASQSEPSIN